MERCQECQTDAPTTNVSLSWVYGMVFLYRHGSLSGRFCKRCIRKYFWKYTLGSLVGGLLSIGSIARMPMVFMDNFAALVSSTQLKANLAISCDTHVCTRLGKNRDRFTQSQRHDVYQGSGVSYRPGGCGGEVGVVVFSQDDASWCRA